MRRNKFRGKHRRRNGAMDGHQTHNSRHAHRPRRRGKRH